MGSWLVWGGHSNGPALAEALPAPSFEDEIARAVAFERKLFYRGLLAALLVVAIVVVRTLFFA